MVYIDAFNEDGKFLGKMEYNEVHNKGFWHNVVYSFIYDGEGNVYFNLKDYFSIIFGHVYSSESADKALIRIFNEQLGSSILNEIFCFFIAPYKKNEVSNGIVIKNRVLANIYVSEIKKNFSKNSFIKINVRDLLKVFSEDEEYAEGIFYINNEEKKVRVSLSNFLINDYEMSIENYCLILEKIAEVTSVIK